MSASSEYDVIVIGGGPAGCTAATLSARQGRRVLLLEREQFPRFRIGESLMPATYWSLERLGVLEKLRATAFLRKHSVQFFVHDGRPTAPFYFSQVEDHESSVTWQVDRAEFDRLLLEHAAEAGVEVHQGAPVRQVVFDGQRATGVVADLPDQAGASISAPVVVDATGQAGLLSRTLKLKQIDPRLKNAALFTRYRGARRDSGVDEGATLVLHTEDQESWFWYIPLPDDLVSVGVVGKLEYLMTERPGTPEQVYAEELCKCPALEERLQGAEQVTDIQAQKDFSYISRRIAGDGWILAGDAFGFLDPIYSSGVFLALKSGEMAADSIADAFEANDFSAARLGQHGDSLVAGIEALRRLVYAFYDRDFSFARFLRRFPDCRDDLTHLLMGNVFRREFNGLIGHLGEAMDLPPDYQPLRLSGEDG
jgi:flavin-dependent dehydrogenase